MEDLLNVTKMIEIKDILLSFRFGFEKNMGEIFENPINIVNNDVSENGGNYQGNEEGR